MRFAAVGIFVLMLASAALGQVGGQILSIGPGANAYRPGCWTPMVVELRSTVSEAMTYQIQVWQEDLDKDHVVFTKDVALSPQTVEDYMLYFVPSPTSEPLKGLRVRVCLPPGPGKKPDDAKVLVERLSMAFVPGNLDPQGGPGFGSLVGKRVLLWVGSGSSYPSFTEYSKTIGLTAQVVPLGVRPTDLGENVLFYDSIDAVVWLDANADDLDKNGAKRLAALEQYVRQGGNLVICQPAEVARIAALAPLLPVETKDAAGNWLITIGQKPSLADYATNPRSNDIRDALPELARSKAFNPPPDLWHLIPGPIHIARAKPRDGALVDYWENWSKTDRTPYIVRRPYGLGCVTWVAQDLGEQKLIGKYGGEWPYVWDHVLGWQDDARTNADDPADSERPDVKNQREALSAGGGTVDLARWMLRGTDFPGKGAAYIFLAILFFILYWVAAGPGSYFYLATKKRKELNWFIFGAWAFVGTAITVLLVRLVLRGNAEARHLTVVRSTPGDPSLVDSRIGLYIPRDGDQLIELKDASHDSISYITPLQMHPAYAQSTDFPAAQVYSIPVHDDPQPVAVRIPFRSTLQKLQTHWVGDLSGGISGAVHLKPMDQGCIDGALTNQTGADLKNVYIAFNCLLPGGTGRRDMVMFIPAWDNKATIDLHEKYATAKNLALPGTKLANSADPSHHDNVIKAFIPNFWDQYWVASWPTNTFAGSGEDDTRGAADYDAAVPRVFPILSLFDRIGPSRNNVETKRVDFIRRGGRVLNMSPAVAAGKLVVLAQSDDDAKPLPYPFLVESARVSGQGRILYQFALPVDRSEMEKGE